MTDPRPALRLAAAVLALVASAGPAAMASIQRAEASRHALIVGTGPGDHGDGLAEILERSYGFEVIHLADARATRRKISAAMEELLARIEPYDHLFVHLAMPTLWESQLYFVPADGEIDSPWTLLSSREVLEWLSRLPTGAALVTYPTCGGSALRDDPRADPVLQDLLSAKTRRPGPVDVLLVCDRAARRLPPTFTALRPDHLTRALTEILTRAAEGLEGVTGRDLAGLQIPGFQVEWEQVPPNRQSPFRFVPAGSVSGYRSRYAAERLPAGLDRVIEDFFAAALDDEGQQPGLAVFLRQIAVDPAAAAAGADLGVKEAHELRAKAVQLLGKIDSVSSRDALIAVSSRARDSGLIRQQAISQLSRLPDLRPRDVEALRSALSDDDPPVREAAVRSLGVVKDEAAAARLSVMVAAEPVERVRLAAIQALSSLEREDTRALFVDALSDEDASIRRAAASALAQLGGSREAVGVLLRRLATDPADAVRESCAFALGRTWVADLQDEVAAGLAAALEAGPEAVAAAAASSLGRIGGDRAEALLGRRLSQSLEAGPEPVRLAVALAEALGRIASPASVPILERAASCESAAVRRAAVTALGMIATDGVVEILFARLDDGDPYVRREAQRALEELRIAEPVAASGITSSSPAIRLRSYQALVEEQDLRRSLGALIRGLGDDSAEVRETVIEGLARSSDPEVAAGVGAALEEGDPLTRQSALRVLGRMPAAVNDPVFELLAGRSEDPSTAIRAEVARAFGLRGDPRGLEILLAAADDPSAEVRAEAALGMGRLASGEEPVLDLLRQMARKDPSPEVRDAAIEALSAGSRRGRW